MANTVIQLKKSATPAAAPSSLAYGELAINYADGVLYYKSSNSSIASFYSRNPSYGTINAAGTLLISDTVDDVLTINQGTNIEISSDALTDSFTITANLAPAFDKANAANVLAYNTGIGANAYTVSVGAAANNWANTKLSNTDNVVFGGNLQISQTMYARDLVLSNSMIANISSNVYNLTVRNNVFIGGSVTNVTQLMFNTGTNITPTVPGALTWSQDDSTLHFDTDSPGNTILHIGQDLVYYVKNQSGQTIYKGNVCMFTGTLGASGRLTVGRAIANNSYPSKYVMGVAADDILNGNDGFVVSQGRVRGIDTSMFNQGDILYLSPTNPGQMQNTMPTAPNNKVTMAAVIYSDASVGSITVRPTYGSKINEDELAEINGVAEGDVLYYVNANGRFENKNTLVRAYGTVNAAYAFANSAYATGNIQYAVTNAAFAHANASYATGNIQYAVTNAAFAFANSAYATGNINYALTNAAFAFANSAYATGNIQYAVTNAAFAFSNSAYATGNINYALTNAAIAHANAAFLSSNGVNTYSDSTYFKKVGGTISGDVVITGNITISGNTTYANTQTLLIGDNILVLNADLPAAAAPSENAGLDVNRGSSANASLWWNETTDKWTFSNGGIFYNIASNTDVENTNTAIQTSFPAVNNYTVSVGTAANSYAGAMANSVNIAHYTYANTTGTGANNFAGTMANSANIYGMSYANTMNTAIQTQFAAVNNYTTSVGTAGNNYTNSVGASANNWANTKLSNGSVTLAGSLNTTGTVTANSYIYITAIDSTGNEGGELILNGAGNYTSWSTDAYQNNYRVFARTGTTVSNVQFFHAIGGGSVRMSVNKTDPAYTVDVNGDVNISGAFRVNGVQIAAGDLTPANNWANTVGTAGNNYTISVGASGNNWANTINTAIQTQFAAVNNYTISVGAAANNWANTKLSNTSGVTFAGDITFTGNVTSSKTMYAQHFDNVSDISLKENIQPITDPMIALSQLNPVSFDWKRDGKKSFGLIAQEVEQVLPEIINIREDGIKTLSYIDIISFLIAAVKQQQEDINILNRKLDDLTSK